MQRWPALQEQLDRFKQREGGRILRDFADWLALPNDAENLAAVEKNASYLEAMLQARGIATEIWRTPEAAPVVYGEYTSPHATRTLLLYAHFDGQPADPDEWTSGDPWGPALYSAAISEGGTPIPFPNPGEPIDPEWRIYARSAGDDKAPFIAMLSALDFLQHAGIEPSVNLKFFFESEEEKGSPSLDQYLNRYKERLTADLIMICDGPVHQSGRPQLYFGARGFTGFTMTLYGPLRHLHSGHYGNWAPNPAMALAHLLGTFKTEAGYVAIDGFYDTVEPLDNDARQALATVPSMDDELRHELALARSDCDNALLNDQLQLPSLNIRGLKSGVADGRIVNMIPDEASVSIDLRLVKGNTPADMLEKVEQHIKNQGYFIVRDQPDAEMRRQHAKLVRIARDPGYEPLRTNMSLPVVQKLIDTLRKTIDLDLILLPTLGGSLPLYCFERYLEAPIVGVPIANHDNNQHGPDENLRIGNLWYGITLFTSLFSNLD